MSFCQTMLMPEPVLHFINFLFLFNLHLEQNLGAFIFAHLYYPISVISFPFSFGWMRFPCLTALLSFQHDTIKTKHFVSCDESKLKLKNMATLLLCKPVVSCVGRFTKYTTSLVLCGLWLPPSSKDSHLIWGWVLREGERSLGWGRSCLGGGMEGSTGANIWAMINSEPWCALLQLWFNTPIKAPVHLQLLSATIW